MDSPHSWEKFYNKFCDIDTYWSEELWMDNLVLFTRNQGDADDIAPDGVKTDTDASTQDRTTIQDGNNHGVASNCRGDGIPTPMYISPPNLPKLEEAQDSSKFVPDEPSESSSSPALSVHKLLGQRTGSSYVEDQTISVGLISSPSPPIPTLNLPKLHEVPAVSKTLEKQATSKSPCPLTSPLKKDTLAHISKKTFVCDVCHKSFLDNSHLKSHTRTHNNEKLFTCQVCNKSFTESNHLKRHIRIHTGERPYSCSVCEKSFTVINHLKNHQRIHSGEKPYTCKVCNRSFSVSTHLTRHLRVHSGERPYACVVCGKSFSMNSHLKRHLLTHTNEKTIVCSVFKKSVM